MAHIIDGKKISQIAREDIKRRSAEFEKETGIKPGLAVVIVGEDPASKVYVRNKKRSCEEVGFYSEVHEMPESVTMEELLAEHLEKRCDFELFKSNVCHKLKECGDVEYMIEILEGDEIGIYYRRKWYPEAFYLLGLLDYLSRVNEVPVCTDYNAMRKQKLDKVIYPQSVRMMAAIKNSKEPLRQAREEAIPEFLNYNIVEGEVRNVV